MGEASIANGGVSKTALTKSEYQICKSPAIWLVVHWQSGSPYFGDVVGKFESYPNHEVVRTLVAAIIDNRNSFSEVDPH